MSACGCKYVVSWIVYTPYSFSGNPQRLTLGISDRLELGLACWGLLSVICQALQYVIIVCVWCSPLVTVFRTRRVRSLWDLFLFFPNVDVFSSLMLTFVRCIFRWRHTSHVNSWINTLLLFYIKPGSRCDFYQGVQQYMQIYALRCMYLCHFVTDTTPHETRGSTKQIKTKSKLKRGLKRNWNKSHLETETSAKRNCDTDHKVSAWLRQQHLWLNCCALLVGLLLGKKLFRTNKTPSSEVVNRNFLGQCAV